MGILNHRGKLICMDFGQMVSRVNIQQMFEFHTAWNPGEGKGEDPP